MALLDGLKKTRKSFFTKLFELFSFSKKIDEDLLEEIEEILVSSDMGVDLSIELIEKIKASVAEKKIQDSEEIISLLKKEMKSVLPKSDTFEDIIKSDELLVILVVGVNGSGKTTTIGKMANYFIKNKKKVLLAACDTFRAAAIEQLQLWAKKNKCEIVSHRHGSDPASVAYDALCAAKSRKSDILIVDTAGRLHTKTNLMLELKKIKNVLKKQNENIKIHTLLVIDGTAGQNAVRQAKEFNLASDISGIAVTKLDGTAKGGMVFSICRELDIPIDFIGTGEKIDDIEPFRLNEFIESFFSKKE